MKKEKNSPCQRRQVDCRLHELTHYGKERENVVHLLRVLLAEVLGGLDHVGQSSLGLGPSASL